MLRREGRLARCIYDLFRRDTVLFYLVLSSIEHMYIIIIAILNNHIFTQQLSDDQHQILGGEVLQVERCDNGKIDGAPPRGCEGPGMLCIFTISIMIYDSFSLDKQHKMHSQRLMIFTYDHLN